MGCEDREPKDFQRRSGENKRIVSRHISIWSCTQTMTATCTPALPAHNLPQPAIPELPSVLTQPRTRSPLLLFLPLYLPAGFSIAKAWERLFRQKRSRVQVHEPGGSDNQRDKRVQPPVFFFFFLVRPLLPSRPLFGVQCRSIQPSLGTIQIPLPSHCALLPVS